MDQAARQKRVSPMALTGKILALNAASFVVIGVALAVYSLVTRFPLASTLLAAIFGGIGVLELLIGLALALFPRESPMAKVVNQYYEALEHQDYMTAFQCLNPVMQTPLGEPISLDWFTENARANDSAAGLVTRYTLAGIRANSLGSLFTLRVTRGGRSYKAHLFLQRQGSEWKIRDFDGF